MDLNETALENELRKMAPREPDRQFLDRLACAMDAAAADACESAGSDKERHLDPELSTLEKTLKTLVPHGMPDNMIARLDEAMARWHERVPVNEKVIPIKTPDLEKQKTTYPGLRAVATVALLGAGAAFLTVEPDSMQADSAEQIPVYPQGGAEPVVFTPGQARASLVSTNDHGVVWIKEGLPVRCVEVKSENEVSFLNDRGEKLTIAQPCREFMFTPVKFD